MLAVQMSVDKRTLNGLINKRRALGPFECVQRFRPTAKISHEIPEVRFQQIFVMVGKAAGFLEKSVMILKQRIAENHR